MSTDDLKIIAPIVAVLGFLFGLYKYRSNKPNYKFRMFPSMEPNSDMCGNYLCARVHISNVGEKTGVYNGFVAIDHKGEEFYPISTFNSGDEIEPQKTISGVIPIGHLLTHPPKALYMQDGLLKKRKLPTKLLKKTIYGLREEQKRCEMVGLAVHPTKSIKQ